MLRSFLAAAAVLVTVVTAQTKTDCNPLNVTCPADTALGISNYTWDMISANKVDYQIWKNMGGIEPTFDGKGSQFTIQKSGQSVSLKSQFYYFFGTATVIMKASPGTGIISAVTLLSDDLDEVDWEFKGSNDSYVFTNFYGKFQDGMPGHGTDVKLNFDPRADYHNYTTVWTKDSLQWFVDGNMVRELKSNDPDTQGGSHYPQTPMQLHIGSWAGGDKSTQPDGVRQWAGGDTDYSKGPFTMEIASVYVSDASTGSTYTYSDKTGSASSIKIEGGNSTIANYLKNSAPGPSLSQRVNDLSSGAKIGIAVGAICVAAIAFIIFIFCCIKQRRAGRKEAAVADAEFQKQEAELMAYRLQQSQQQRPGQMPGFGYQEFRGKH